MKLKTLRELADEVGFPFDASSDLYADKSIQVFHCIGIAPDGKALGWYTEGTTSWINKAVTENKSSCWTLVTPKKKLIEYACDSGHKYPDILWEYGGEAEARKHCDSMGAHFIKILREIEL